MDVSPVERAENGAGATLSRRRDLTKRSSERAAASTGALSGSGERFTTVFLLESTGALKARPHGAPRPAVSAM
jgi:hypothetical protein